MNERDLQSRGESTARRLADSAQDAASRAGDYMQKGMRQASDAAQDLAEEARNRVVRLTGRPLESWTGDVRRLVSDHPLQALAITIGIGYILGKLMQRD
ncbi:MAG TPA: hypothetical protein VGL09_13520 [Methylomirabilota bacterium]|jgi:ElaB/YqjD/DUF883 family membrane-anchored ribosome-binding protein